MSVEDYLANIYYNPKHPGSFSGPHKLQKVIQQEGKHQIGLSAIKKWLSAQETYTLHRSARHKVVRNKVVVDGLDDQWDLDLMDMTNIAEHNDGYRYVLLAIDIFSRYVWVEPLKSKQGKEILRAKVWQGFTAIIEMHCDDIEDGLGFLSGQTNPVGVLESQIQTILDGSADQMFPMVVDDVVVKNGQYCQLSQIHPDSEHVERFVVK